MDTLEITLYENESCEKVPGGYLVVNDSYYRPVYGGYARLQDGSLEYLGQFEQKRDALHTVETASHRKPL